MIPVDASLVLVSIGSGACIVAPAKPTLRRIDRFDYVNESDFLYIKILCNTAASFALNDAA